MNSADPMDQSDVAGAPIRMTTLPDGGWAYAIEGSPRGLPPVTRRDLDLAWQDARQAALDGRWGTVRGFRFRRPDGSATDLALADPDARCWAGAVDARVGLNTRYGLSILLRLLALVDLLARAPWSQRLCQLAPGGGRDGAALDGALLGAAAVAELTEDACFDESALHACMVAASRGTADSPFPTRGHTGRGRTPRRLAGASA